MPIQIFIDESGGRTQGRYFVMAGLISTAEKWAAFSDAWRGCLDRAPRWKSLHMTEVASKRRRAGDEKRVVIEGKLLELSAIIGEHVEAGIYIEIEVEPFYEVFKDFNPKRRMDWLYFYAFYGIMMGTCMDLLDAKVKEKLEIIFDENKMHGPRTLQYYPLTREFMRVQHPASDLLLPPSPIFKTDDEFVPLQAADLMAWSRLRAGDDFPFGFLFDTLKHIPLSQYSGTINEQDIKTIRAGNKRELYT